MVDESLKDRVIRDLVLLSTVGIRPILVHGGGPEINQWLTKVGIEVGRCTSSRIQLTHSARNYMLRYWRKCPKCRQSTQNVAKVQRPKAPGFNP